MNDIYKSIYQKEEDILNAILTIHSKNKCIELDVTYSKGNTYKNTSIKEPQYKTDINPQYDDVIKANVECLPFNDNQFNTIYFDPPFLATTGKSLKKDDKNNKINKRFGVYPNEQELFSMYSKALKELYRCLNDDGILIFKCQDKVSSGKQYFSHCFIYNKALELDYYPKDLLILESKSRLVANWQLNQKHVRKFHCYYWVLQKTKKEVTYEKEQ